MNQKSNIKNQRLIFFDTETTGLSPTNGDKIVEIGCVEMINGIITGEHFHQAFKELFKASNPIPIKALLKEIQFIHYNDTRPPLSSYDFKSLNELLLCHKMISDLEN